MPSGSIGTLTYIEFNSLFKWQMALICDDLPQARRMWEGYHHQTAPRPEENSDIATSEKSDALARAHVQLLFFHRHRHVWRVGDTVRVQPPEGQNRCQRRKRHSPSGCPVPNELSGL